MLPLPIKAVQPRARITFNKPQQKGQKSLEVFHRGKYFILLISKLSYISYYIWRCGVIKLNLPFSYYRISVGRGNATRTGRGPFGGVVFRSKTLPQPSSSNSHATEITKHGLSANGWSRCGICNKTFLTLANLKQHMLLHQGGKPFRCNFCAMRLVNNAEPVLW